MAKERSVGTTPRSFDINAASEALLRAARRSKTPPKLECVKSFPYEGKDLTPGKVSETANIRQCGNASLAE